MHIILYFLILFFFECGFVGCCDTHLHKICVNLIGKDSILNKHLCEEIGLTPCSASSHVCKINPKVITNAYDKEKCLKTLFSFFSTIACNDYKPKDYIYYTDDGTTTVYVDKEISNLLWKSCSKRSKLRISYLFEQDEPKRFCKNLTLSNSPVKIRQAINLPGLSKIFTVNLDQIAEINWLMGSPISWNLVRLKISGVLVIIFIILLSISSIYVREGTKKRNIKYKIMEPEDNEVENLIELVVNLEHYD